MRRAIWIAMCIASLGTHGCGDSDTTTSGTGGAGGTGGSGGSGGANADGGTPDGGTPDGSTPDGGATPETACAEAAEALCGRISTCASFFAAVLFGDVATCVDIAKSSCVASLRAKDTGATPAKLSQCARDLTTASCTDVLSHNPPASCRPAGPIGDGMPCGDDWQCESGVCSLSAGSLCGVCGRRADPNGICGTGRDEECAYGETCTSRICSAPVPGGGSCAQTLKCAHPYVCSAASTCVMGGGPGAPCMDGRGCADHQGLWCPPAINTCATIQMADPGMPCGLLGSGQYVACKGAGDDGCKRAAGSTMGICPRLALPGEECGGAAGTSCRTGAVCAAMGTTSICTVRDPSTCR
jgi:hypothetical protein